MNPSMIILSMYVNKVHNEPLKKLKIIYVPTNEEFDNDIRMTDHTPPTSIKSN